MYRNRKNHAGAKKDFTKNDNNPTNKLLFCFRTHSPWDESGAVIA